MQFENLKITQGNTEYEMMEFKSECLPTGFLPGTPIINYQGKSYFLQAIPNKSKEVPIPDYEIIQAEGLQDEIHDWVSENNKKDWAPCNKIGCNIYSVKRLSDGVTFSIGDTCVNPSLKNYYYKPIKRFFIKDGLMYMQFNEGHGSNDGCLTINSVEKAEPKQKLFQDQLGNDIFDMDKIYQVSIVSNYTLTETIARIEITPPPSYFKYFLNKIDAIDFITWNKPHLSLAEVMAISEWYDGNEITEQRLFYSAKLRHISSSKINL